MRDLILVVLGIVAFFLGTPLAVEWAFKRMERRR